MSTHSVSEGIGIAVPGSTEVTVYAEGMLAGGIGAATIALWFLALDILQGRPFYTPTVLGTALFGGSQALGDSALITPSFEIVLSFTWVHTLAFLLIGMAASRLVDAAERNPNLGFGIVILFVVFQFGFLEVSMIVADEMPYAVAWPAVMGGNLLAAAAMVLMLSQRHPRLVIAP